jgi:hypothetical protein
LGISPAAEEALDEQAAAEHAVEREDASLPGEVLRHEQFGHADRAQGDDAHDDAQPEQDTGVGRTCG